MKRAKMWLGLLVVSGFVSGSVGAEPIRRETITSNGVEWSYSIIGEIATVTGADPAEGVLEIPSTLGGYTVGCVGYRAFASCEALTGVVIPAGVRSIGDRAFQYCTALEDVSIPAGVTNIGTMAFQYCESLSTLVLPQSVESIGTSALYYCNGLSKLYVPLAWWGTMFVSNAGVGSACSVVYGEPGIETVFFDANGGICDISSHNYPLGDAYGWFPEPSRPLFAFVGWWTATNEGGIVTVTNAASVEGRNVLYAHWKTLEQTVTFDATGGTCETSNRTYMTGSHYSPLPEAMRPHYAFAGWWTVADGGMEVTEESTVTTEATLTLYAHWTLTEQVVSFNANGGRCDTNNGAYSIGGRYSPLPKPVREGYVFDGWFSAKNGGDRISEATAVTASATRTFYAHWTLVEQLVTFDPNGGNCETETHSYAIGGTYDWFPEPSRDGCVFNGWRTSSGERVEVTSMVPQSRSQTLYAYWLQYVISNGTATVTRLLPTNAVGTIEIPASIGGCPVKVIGESAFMSCNKITSVRIPGGVTNIGNYVFSACSGLKGVELPDSVMRIGNSAFSDCTKLTSVTIPDSVTSIGERAFYNCNALTSMTIPDSVTSIGDSVFHNCNGLTNMMISECVTSIGSYAFYGCRSLTSVTIPNSVSHVGYSAFSYCTGLTSMTFGSSVTNIGSDAFYGCTGLASVRIPPSVMSIGRNAFAGCASSLYDETSVPGVILVDGWAIKTTSSLPGDLDLTGVHGIAANVFDGCSALRIVTIPDSVASIGDHAFHGCTNLTAVHISDLAAWCRITFISEYSNPLSCARRLYLDGEEVTSLTIPDSVTSIGDYAFYDCTSLRSVRIPESVTSIGDYAFDYCRELKSVCIPQCVCTSSLAGLFPSSYTNIQDVTICNGTTTIGDHAFSRCTGLKSVSIPSTVTIIGRDAFEGDSNLTAVYIHDLAAWCGISFVEPGFKYSNPLYYAKHLYLDGEEVKDMTIPDSVTCIGNNVFQGFAGLASVVISDSVTSIGRDAFSDCTSLTSVAIPNSVTNFGGGAFSGCIGLTSVAIPDNVTSVGDSAFYGCSNLTAVYIHDLAAWCGITFGSEKSNPLYYAKHLFLNGGEVTNMTIPDGVTSIGNYAFSRCTELKSVKIPDSVTSIGSRAFAECGSSLYDKTTIPGITLVDGWAIAAAQSLSGALDLTGVRGIAGSAFSGCSRLTRVTIPDNVKGIGGAAFYGCTNLTAVHIQDLAAWCGMSIASWAANPLYYAKHLYLDGEEVISMTIPDSVTRIGNNAFLGFTGLTSVVISDSVASIGNYAFDGCSGLRSVTIGSSVTNIGMYAFSSCTGLTDMTIPNSVLYIGSYAFSHCAGLRSVEIPDSVTSIGDDAFDGCTGLTNVMIPDSVTYLGNWVFRSCSGLMGVTIGNSVTNIGNYAFYDCSGLTCMTIPDNVKGIGLRVFYGCTGLRTLYVPVSWKTKYVNGWFWSSYADVPSGCNIIYYEPEEPCTTTGVPHSWLAAYGLGDGTAEGYEAAAMAKAANNVYTVAECYVAGLNPIDKAAAFAAYIAFTNGHTVVSWTPDLKEERAYKLLCKRTLSDEKWEEVPDGAVADADGRRFFRVRVELRQE